jgi:Flp pilus assembly protein TadG
VEAAYAAVLLVVLLGLVFDVALWGHAQNVATVAVQDGARVAAAQGGDLAHGRARAQDLLAAGLGSSASLITVTVNENRQSVTFNARGEWSVISGPGVHVGFPIAAESRMLKHEWHP